jgi:7,8-dihydropterin-6-yl-methyl-4-(beta-D-ribofuranosyl)aminobenzene 5'-phosphate synthase
MLRHDHVSPRSGGALHLGLLLILVFFAVLATAVFAGQNRVTILTDAFGRKEGLEPDWGYSVLIEFEGRRILFDTGDNSALLQRNIERMHVDLSHLDLVVISHAHGDHASGLRYVLSLNPNVPLFVPDEVFFRGHEVPRPFLTTNPEPALPPERRYYGGKPPAHIPDWQGWNDANMTVVKEAREIAPRIRLVSVVSEKPLFRGLQEVSLVLDTPKGAIIVAGCSHPGIERIMAAATANVPARPVYMLLGGLHLVEDSREQITHTLSILANQYHVQKMAVGHCTGELAFALIHEKWGENDLYAGLGEVLEF